MKDVITLFSVFGTRRGERCLGTVEAWQVVVGFRKTGAARMAWEALLVMGALRRGIWTARSRKLLSAAAAGSDGAFRLRSRGRVLARCGFS